MLNICASVYPNIYYNYVPSFVKGQFVSNFVCPVLCKTIRFIVNIPFIFKHSLIPHFQMIWRKWDFLNSYLLRFFLPNITYFFHFFLLYKSCSCSTIYCLFVCICDSLSVCLFVCWNVILVCNGMCLYVHKLTVGVLFWFIHICIDMFVSLFDCWTVILVCICTVRELNPFL